MMNPRKKSGYTEEKLEDLTSLRSEDQIFLYEGARIKELRKRLNLTQEQLADKIGVTKLTVSRWESGERKCKEIARILMYILTKYNLWSEV